MQRVTLLQLYREKNTKTVFTLFEIAVDLVLASEKTAALSTVSDLLCKNFRTLLMRQYFLESNSLMSVKQIEDVL